PARRGKRCLQRPALTGLPPAPFAPGMPHTRNCPRRNSRPQGRPLPRSEEHTSELQSRFDLVCRLLLEKKKKKVEPTGRGRAFLPLLIYLDRRYLSLHHGARNRQCPHDLGSPDLQLTYPFACGASSVID